MNDSNIKSDANGKGGSESEWKRMNAAVAGPFALLIITSMPVILWDYYFDILSFKYYFRCVVAILMAIVMLIVTVVYDSKERDQPDRRGMREVMKGLSIKSLLTPDWAMTCSFLVAVISTFQSEYFYEPFWGNEGRHCGSFLIILYMISFFSITKHLGFKQWYLDVFLVTGMVICIVGILHYFQYDPLGFKVDSIDKDYKTFTSTIGNINIYASLIALLMGMSPVLFAIEVNLYKKIWYFVCLTVSLLSLIIGISDNACLAPAALHGFLPLYPFSNLKGFKHYILILAVLFSEFQLTDSLTQKISDHVMEISGLLGAMSGCGRLAYIVITPWLMVVALYVLDIRTKDQNTGRGESNIGRYIWLAIIVIVVLLVAFIFYDVNVRGDVDKYGPLSGYLLFNDDWGVHRGYIWWIGMESYQCFPLSHRVFGYSPNTSGIIAKYNYYEDMVNRYGEKFESVHSEYLQYLIIIGAASLMSYIGLLFVPIWKMPQDTKKEPAIIAIISALICYGAQVFVSISVSMVAPVMLALMMIGLSAVWDTRSHLLEDTIARGLSRCHTG